MDMYTSKRLAGCQAAIASKLGSHNGSGYIRESQAGCQAAFASKLGSHSGSGYIRESQVGCQAAIAGKPAPTGSVQNREVAEDREIAILRPITL
jgi:hypothetical protein